MKYPKKARVLIQFSFEPTPELFSAMTLLNEKMAAQSADTETLERQMFTLVSDAIGLNASEQKTIPQMLSLSGSDDEVVTDDALHASMMHKCLEDYQKASGRSALESLLASLKGFPNFGDYDGAEPNVN